MPSASVDRARAAMAAPRPEAGAIGFCMPLAGVKCALLATGPTGDPVATDYAHFGSSSMSPGNAVSRGAPRPAQPHVGGREAEAANGAATRAVQVYEQIAATGSSVIVAHHTAQWDRRSREASTSSARGVTALTDGARWMMHLGSERLEGVDEHLREIVTATANAKSNYSRRGGADRAAP